MENQIQQFDRLLAAYTQAVIAYGEALAAWKQSERYDPKRMSADMSKAAEKVEAARLELREVVENG